MRCIVVLLLCAGLYLSLPVAYAADHTVGLSGVSFSPATLTIQAGDRIVFQNLGGAHDVVSNGFFRCAKGCDGDGAGGNGNVAGAPWTATVAFPNPGTFEFYCEAHVIMGMRGTVTVLPAGAFTLGPGISGNWYNAAQDGHGFQLEVLKDAPTVVTAFWFVFDNAGNQVWINGVGTIAGNKVVMQAGRVLGGRFPPNFDSAQTTKPAWGTLTFTFTDCGRGHVDWTTTDPAFTPSGGFDLVRLTAIAGTSCP